MHHVDCVGEPQVILEMLQMVGGVRNPYILGRREGVPGVIAGNTIFGKTGDI